MEVLGAGATGCTLLDPILDRLYDGSGAPIAVTEWFHADRGARTRLTFTTVNDGYHFIAVAGGYHYAGRIEAVRNEGCGAPASAVGSSDADADDDDDEQRAERSASQNEEADKNKGSNPDRVARTDSNNDFPATTATHGVVAADGTTAAGNLTAGDGGDDPYPPYS